MKSDTCTVGYARSLHLLFVRVKWGSWTFFFIRQSWHCKWSRCSRRWKFTWHSEQRDKLCAKLLTYMQFIMQCREAFQSRGRVCWSRSRQKMVSTAVLCTSRRINFCEPKLKKKEKKSYGFCSCLRIPWRRILNYCVLGSCLIRNWAVCESLDILCCAFECVVPVEWSIWKTEVWLKEKKKYWMDGIVMFAVTHV